MTDQNVHGENSMRLVGELYTILWQNIGIHKHTLRPLNRICLKASVRVSTQPITLNGVGVGEAIPPFLRSVNAQPKISQHRTLLPTWMHFNSICVQLCV